MKRSRPEVLATSIPDWRDALAGAAAGALSKTAMAPVERVKLLLQLGEFRGPARLVAARIYREQGLLAFWRGNAANVVRTAGQAALNFALMDYYKRVAAETRKQYTITGRDNRKLVTSLVSGGMAGGTATTVLYPMEFLRTRLAVDKQLPRGMWSLLTRTFRTDGIRGLYQGYGIALFGGIFYRLLYLGGYDALKDEWLEQKQNMHRLMQRANLQSDSSEKSSSALPTSLSWVERMVAAQTISLTAGTICYPIDSVRRRLMMQAGKPPEQKLYRNSFNCIAVVARTEGVRGFYLGILPNMVRSVGGALCLVAYDGIKVTLF